MDSIQRKKLIIMNILDILKKYTDEDHRLSQKEIAEKLNISQRTVEVHKNNIFKKLGINNTVELVRYMQIIMREGSNLGEKNPDNA